MNYDTNSPYKFIIPAINQSIHRVADQTDQNPSNGIWNLFGIQINPIAFLAGYPTDHDPYKN